MRRVLGLVGLLVVLGSGCGLSSDRGDANNAASPTSSTSTSTTRPSMQTTITSAPTITSTSLPPSLPSDFHWGLHGIGPFAWGDDFTEVRSALTDILGPDLQVRTQSEPSACGVQFDGVWTEIAARGVRLIFLDGELARYDVFGDSAPISEWGTSLDMTLDEHAAAVPEGVLEEHFWFGRWWRLGSGDGTQPWLYATGPVGEPIGWVSARAPETPGPCYD